MLKQSSLAGAAEYRTQSTLLSGSPHAVDILIDVLSDRGFRWGGGGGSRSDLCAVTSRISGESGGHRERGWECGPESWKCRRHRQVGRPERQSTPAPNPFSTRGSSCDALPRSVAHTLEERLVPQQVDLQTGDITCRPDPIHIFRWVG